MRAPSPKVRSEDRKSGNEYRHTRTDGQAAPNRRDQAVHDALDFLHARGQAGGIL